jgi:hypothetical protein
MQTVFEAAGGNDGLRRLAGAWHRQVMADDVVGHAFSHGFHPLWVDKRSSPSRLKHLRSCDHGPSRRVLRRVTREL